MRRIRRKAIVVAGAVLAIALGSVAYAYFTTSGSGTGTASVGSSSALTLHGTTAGALLPGTSSTVSFTVDNPSAGHQRVGTIHLDSVDAPNGCSAADFTMPDVVANQDVASGNGTAITATGTLSMANNGNQDACKGGSLTLHLSSN